MHCLFCSCLFFLICFGSCAVFFEGEYAIWFHCSSITSLRLFSICRKRQRNWGIARHRKMWK
jgi:hypothetical protein